jgi:hypothetical protein
MKGIVFTEFLELVEDNFGLSTVNEIIDRCDLKTDGAYTAVGTYDHGEMFQMVKALSDIQNTPVPDLLRFYGKYFFDVLAKGYPAFLENHDLFSFMESIDGYIHPEVQKLYPEAELPSFESVKTDHDDEMLLIYKSSRKMSDFAIGLIYGAAAHYKIKVEVEEIKREKDGEIVHIQIKRLE